LEEYLKKIKLLHNEPDGYYTILEISPKATTDEIKKSYRKLSLIYHPNKLLNKKNNKVYKISTEIFTIIGDCYATLSDSDKKKKYDNLQKNTKKH
jgi:curved DNA-binding protein CbpA